MTSRTAAEKDLQSLLALVSIPDPVMDSATVTPHTVEALLPLLRFERILGWAWHRLRQTGQFEACPAEVQQTLRLGGMAHTTKAMQLTAGLSQVLTILDGSGCRALPLKGVAYALIGDRYPYLRYRGTGDLDLLVEPGLAQRAWDALVAAGYQRIHDGESIHADHHHLPGIRGSFGIAVEVHTAASLFWTPALSWARFWDRGDTTSLEGKDIRIPNATELLWHNLIHSLGDGGAGCRLRDLLTSAALIAGPDPIDWGVIGHRLRTEPIRDHDSRHPVRPAGGRRWLATALAMSGTDAPVHLGLPADPLPRLRGLLRYRCRMLAQAEDSRIALHMDDSARAAFGLGLGRLAHWQPRWLQPKRVLAGLATQLRYRWTA